MGFISKILSFAFVFFVIVGILSFLSGDNNITGFFSKGSSDINEFVDSAKDSVKDSAIESVSSSVENADFYSDYQDLSEGFSLKDFAVDKFNQVIGRFDTFKMINKVLLLRSYSANNNIVGVASLITDINSLVEDSDDEYLINYWNVALGCAYNHCDDKVFLDLIDSSAVVRLNSRNKAINSLIETINLWGGSDIVEFSESLSRTDGFINSLKDDELTEQWLEFVSCNAKCVTFSDDLFNLIYRINNV